MFHQGNFSFVIDNILLNISIDTDALNLHVHVLYLTHSAAHFVLSIVYANPTRSCTSAELGNAYHIHALYIQNRKRSWIYGCWRTWCENTPLKKAVYELRIGCPHDSANIGFICATASSSEFTITRSCVTCRRISIETYVILYRCEYIGHMA